MSVNLLEYKSLARQNGTEMNDEKSSQAQSAGTGPIGSLVIRYGGRGGNYATTRWEGAAEA